MILAIDCGNTNIVFALFSDDHLVGEWRTGSEHGKTADELGVWLIQLFQMENIERSMVEGVIIASVVPALMYSLKTLVQRYFKITPLVVGSDEVKLGLKVLLDNPAEVGADRLVNALGAHARYKLALIVVDFGTATTFDVVNENGDYCGGAIAPGVLVSMDALHMAAAQLPKIAISAPHFVIGKSTVPAMQSGIVWGYVGLVKGLVARIKNEIAQPMKVIATGGLAGLFSGLTKVIDVYDPDLTLYGLYLIYKLNQSSPPLAKQKTVFI